MSRAGKRWIDRSIEGEKSDRSVVFAARRSAFLLCCSSNGHPQYTGTGAVSEPATTSTSGAVYKVKKQPTTMAEDELLAAEEEYQRKRRLHSDDGWAEAQPDAGLPPSSTNAAAADEGAKEAEGDDGKPKKRARLSEEDKKRGNRMFGAMMVGFPSPFGRLLGRGDGAQTGRLIA